MNNIYYKLKEKIYTVEFNTQCNKSKYELDLPLLNDDQHDIIIQMANLTYVR